MEVGLPLLSPSHTPEQAQALLFDSMPKLLFALQQANNGSRKKAEAAFTQLSRNNPLQCARELVSCFEREAGEGSRALAAVLLRRFARREEQWDADAVAGWRHALWQGLQKERSPLVSRLLCDAIASEAANSGWPEACARAGETLSVGADTATMIKSLHLVRALAREGDQTTLSESCADTMAELVARCCEMRGLALASATCAICLARHATMREGGAMQNKLAPACLRVCGESLERGELEIARFYLDALVEAASDAPRLFASSASTALRLGCAVAACPQLEVETRGRGLELVCALCETAPSADVVGAVEVAFDASLHEAPADAANTWACPRRPLGDDEDELESMIALGDHALRRIAAAAPDVAAATLLRCVERAYAQDRKRAALAGVLALALGSPSSLQPHVAIASQLAIGVLKDFRIAAPRDTLEACRLAAALAVSCRDCASEHIAQHLPDVLAPVIEAARIASPRLCGAACAALALAVSGDDEDDDDDNEESAEVNQAYTSAVADALLRGQLGHALATALFETTDNNARLAALDALAQAATAAGSDFMACYPDFVPRIVHGITADADPESRAHLERCAVTCGMAVGADTFRVEAQLVFDIVLADVETYVFGNDGGCGKHDDDQIDLAFELLAPTAVELCRLFSCEAWLQSKLDRLARPLLLAAAATPEIAAGHDEPLDALTQDDDASVARREADGSYSLKLGSDLRVKVDLRALWSKEKAVDCIGELLDALDADAPDSLVLAAADALAPLTTFAGSSAVRATAALSLAQVFEVAIQKVRAGQAADELAAGLARRAVAACATALDAETTSARRVDHARALANVLEHVLNASPGGFECSGPPHLATVFSDGDLDSLAQTLCKRAAESLERRRRAASLDAASGDGDKGLVTSDDGDEDETNLQTQLVNALGCLSKLGRPSFARAFDHVVAPFFAQLLADDQPQDRYAGLCVLMDAVDKLPGAAHKYARPVLDAAVAALADPELAQDSPDLVATAGYAVAVVARADRTISLPDPRVLQRHLDHEEPRVAENCLNAIYEMARNTNSPRLLDLWLSRLPIQVDLEEARRANRYLIQLLDDPRHAVLAVARLADALADESDNFPEPPSGALDHHARVQILHRLQSLCQQTLVTPSPLPVLSNFLLVFSQASDSSSCLPDSRTAQPSRSGASLQLCVLGSLPLRPHPASLFIGAELDHDAYIIRCRSLERARLGALSAFPSLHRAHARERRLRNILRCSSKITIEAFLARSKESAAGVGRSQRAQGRPTIISLSLSQTYYVRPILETIYYSRNNEIRNEHARNNILAGPGEPRP